MTSPARRVGWRRSVLGGGERSLLKLNGLRLLLSTWAVSSVFPFRYNVAGGPGRRSPLGFDADLGLRLQGEDRRARAAITGCWSGLMNDTVWENYGHGKDPRCEHCMVHCGYEPSAALGVNRQLGDSLKMLLWNLT